MTCRKRIVIMDRKRNIRLKNILAWLLALVLVSALLPVPAAAETLSSSMTSSQAADLVRQEMNQNRAELKQELEKKGYEVSEENLDRYIEAFVAAYQNGMNYVMSNQDRMISAMQDAVAAGYSQAQLEQLNESLIVQLMAESGFDPDAIARDIFPLKSAAPAEEAPAAPAPSAETPSTPASSSEASGNTSAPESGGSAPAPAETPPADTSGSAQTSTESDKNATYFTAADDSVFSSISGSIRSWAFDKKQASETRKKIMDPDKSAETASSIIINMAGKVADTVGSVGTAVVDTYYDFIDNVADGDGVFLGAVKSLSANTANGVAGIFIGSADLIAYTFSRIPFVRAEFPNLPDRMDFGKNIKGPINFFMGSVFNGQYVAETRAASGTYGINMKEGLENMKNRPATPPKQEIAYYEQKYNQSVDKGAGRIVFY
jgi:hypothetical protein